MPDNTHGEPTELLTRSPQTDELLGRPPGWILRMGPTLVLMLLALATGLAALIRYPDVIAGDALITSAHPPLGVHANADGDLAQLRVANGQLVSKGDVIAILASAVDSASALQLNTWLQDDTAGGSDAPARIDGGGLGPLEEPLHAFVRARAELAELRATNPLGQRITAARATEQRLRDLLVRQAGQVATLRAEHRLIANEQARLSRLGARKLVATQAIDDLERELLISRRDRERVETEMARTEVEIAGSSARIGELELERRARTLERERASRDARALLRAALDQWSERYLLRAPIDGVVALVNVWTQHQRVAAGEEVAVIVPTDAQSIIARVRVPLHNVGKIEVGAQTLLRLDAYPYREHGQLSGTVARISLVPREQRYLVEVPLPSPLTTSLGQVIAMHQRMHAQAEIITADTSLLERLFARLASVFS